MKFTPLYRFGKSIRFLFRFFMPYQTNQTENMPETGRVIVCSNHLSMKDPLLLALIHKRQIFFMAKSELFKNKLVARVITALGAFPVQRGKGDTEAMGKAKELLQQEKAVGIFIEGTREKDGKLLRPKSGAMVLAYENHAPVLPVCITTKDGRAPHLFHKCVISCGELITPEELGIAEASSLEYRKASRLVMERIAALRERDQKVFEKH